jgi:hypothetical protein
MTANSKSRTRTLLLQTALMGPLVLAPGAALAQVPPQLVGEWNIGSVSMLQYVNPITRERRPSASSGASYEFKADGTFRYSWVYEVGRSPCVSKAFDYREGTFAVHGGSLTLNAKKHISSVSGCVNSPESDKGPMSQTEQWTVGPDPSYPKRIMLKIGNTVFFRQ